ncbi:odorant receptor 43b-like [Bactrocera oleae]|uniref:odorant receptor 43b-like n=1 Tax=Bactrocera oleae TaxID=104688 RepID=UPI00387EBEAF
MRTILDLYYGRGNENFETKESFQLIFWCWSLMGIKPLKPFGFCRLWPMAFGWTWLLMSPVAFNVGVMLIMRNSSMTVILTTLQAAINVTGLPMKAVVAACYLHRLRSVDPIFKILDARYQSPEERLAIRENVIQSARLFVTFIVSYFTYATISWLPSLFTHTQPLNIWLPLVDWIQQPTIHFWLHFLIEVIYIYFLLTIQCMSDLYPVVYIKAVRTHITLLTERVSRLGENPNLTDEDNYQELIDCVRTHQELLQ